MRIPIPLILFISVCVMAASWYLFPKPAQIGQALEQVGRLEESVAYYRSALAEQPLDELTWVRVANVHLLLGEPDEAISAYRHLVDLDSVDVGYRRHLAELHDWSLQVDQAMVHKAKIAELDSKDVAVRQELANYYVLDRKDYVTAIRLVEEIVAARPRDAEALFDLAQLYGQSGRLSLAIATFERAVEEDPTNPVIARGLAKANSWSRQIEAAIARYRGLLAIDPNDAAARDGLRDLLRNVGQSDEAVSP